MRESPISTPIWAVGTSNAVGVLLLTSNIF
jgi:hypothetical protein